jgi:hypothetical protein
MPETSIYRVVDLTGTPEQVASHTWLLSGFPNVVFRRWRHRDPRR